MSNQEEKSPYYSTRIRISDVTSPKAWLGYKERTIEVTYGNLDTKIIRNQADISEVIQERSIKDDLLRAFRETDEVGEARGFKFVDETKKNEKGDPLEQ